MSSASSSPRSAVCATCASTIHGASGTGSADSTAAEVIDAGFADVDALIARRIAALERQTMDLQRAVDEWQQAYNRLKQQFVESIGRDPL